MAGPVHHGSGLLLVLSAGWREPRRGEGGRGLLHPGVAEAVIEAQKRWGISDFLS